MHANLAFSPCTRIRRWSACSCTAIFIHLSQDTSATALIGLHGFLPTIHDPPPGHVPNFSGTSNNSSWEQKLSLNAKFVLGFMLRCTRNVCSLDTKTDLWIMHLSVFLENLGIWDQIIYPRMELFNSVLDFSVFFLPWKSHSRANQLS